MINALYRGPAIQSLHQDYAKRGLVDKDAPIQAQGVVDISGPVERVWDVLSAVADWPSVDSALRDIDLPGAVSVDAPFVWTNGKTRIRSRFAVVDPCREFTWTGEAMGARSVHRHVLHRIDARNTRLESQESMAGLFLTALYSSSKLDQSLTSWLAAIKAAVEDGA
jgi:hypothetical protein